MSQTTPNTETSTLHFDLRHAAPHKQFHLNTGNGQYELNEHTAETRALHRTKNKALALLPMDQLEKVTHYVEDVELPSGVARQIRVTFPVEDSDANIPALALTAIYLPLEGRRRHREKEFAQHKPTSDQKLARYGVTEPFAEDEALEILEDADRLIESSETAIATVCQHPQLASRDHNTANLVKDLIKKAQGLNHLADQIEIQGRGWAPVTPSVDKDGKPLQWGDHWHQLGKSGPVYHHKLSNKTMQAVGEPLREACRSSQDDPRLQGKKWSVNQGTPDHGSHANDVTAPPAAAKEGASGFKFTLNNLTPGHGLDIDKSSIRYEPGSTPSDSGTFSIDVKNSYLRTLYANAEFFDEGGNKIPQSGGKGDYLPIDYVTAVDVILGIPMPAEATTLNFPWPEEAASAHLLHGGIGTSLWNSQVDVSGMFLTGVFQYGIPALFLLAGDEIDSSAWYKSVVEDKPLREAILDVCEDTIGGQVASGPAAPNVKSVLLAFGDAIAGMLVHKGLEALADYVTEKLTEGEFEAAIPFVGQVAQVASRLLDYEDMAETTVEVLSSPATYTVEITRAFSLQVTMHPDPLAVIWPDVATKWKMQVQYKNGTNYSQNGDLSRTSSSSPIVVAFPELPAGGQMQLKFCVYSDNDWLAGQWTSAWMDAQPPAGGVALTVDGSIQEYLVKLTSATRYSYKQNLAWNGTAHVWSADGQPKAVVTDLDCSDLGANLCEPVNITINDKAYMLGYCWQASGQNLPLCGSSDPDTGQIHTFQNINVLAKPQASYKFPDCGFENQPYLVYDQFGPAPLFDLSQSAEEALNKKTISSDIFTAFKDFNYELPTDATVEVKKKSVQWTIGWPGQSAPAYDLQTGSAAIEVHPYPTPPFSPNNFYVDPRNDEYNLRRVVLDNSTPFDLDPTTSWGMFNEPHMDAFAVHPAGYVIGVSWMNHKMEILKLPKEGVPESEPAPLAVIVSGKGVRQGLLQGPKAVAVSADGRILILETINKRIQSFDINGNPSPCFDGDQVTTLSPATYGPDLDNGLATVGLRQQFASAGAALSSNWIIVDSDSRYTIKLDGASLRVTKTGADLSTQWTITDGTDLFDVRITSDELAVSQGGTHLFTLELKNQDSLDRDVVGASIVKAFKDNDITLSPRAVVSGNGLLLDPATYEPDLAQGVISNALGKAFLTRNVTLSNKATVTSSVLVTVKQKDALWIVNDKLNSTSYKISLSTDKTSLAVVNYLPYAPLYESGDDDHYLAMATEFKGYMYVLSYKREGSSPDDYQLDIYQPTGPWLCRTQGVNAAKLTIDMWRNMYTLNYDTFQGPVGTEPSVSTWIPSTP